MQASPQMNKKLMYVLAGLLILAVSGVVIWNPRHPVVQPSALPTSTKTLGLALRQEIDPYRGLLRDHLGALYREDLGPYGSLTMQMRDLYFIAAIGNGGEIKSLILAVDKNTHKGSILVSYSGVIDVEQQFPTSPDNQHMIFYAHQNMSGSCLRYESFVVNLRTGASSEIIPPISTSESVMTRNFSWESATTVSFGARTGKCLAFSRGDIASTSIWIHDVVEKSYKEGYCHGAMTSNGTLDYHCHPISEGQHVH